jgi:hypothetical protein
MLGNLLASTTPLVVSSFCLGVLRFELKKLIIFFILAFLMESYGFYQTLIAGNNHYLQHIYVPLEYALLVYIFSGWQRNRVSRDVLRISIPLFMLFCLANIFYQGKLDSYNYAPAALASVIYAGLSGYTLYGIFTSREDIPIKTPRFWIAAALLLYSSGNIAYYSFHELVAKNLLVEIWIIHAAINILTYQLYAIGVLCYRLR